MLSLKMHFSYHYLIVIKDDHGNEVTTVICMNKQPGRESSIFGYIPLIDDFKTVMASDVVGRITNIQMKP